MKILLVGELSGFHNNLKSGLRRLGHEVTIAGSGDGWKKFPVDINFSSIDDNFYNKVYRALKPLLNVNQLAGYDVVQFATPLLFNPIVNALFYFLINKINHGNSHLCAISSNDPYYLEATSQMKYSPFQDFSVSDKHRYYPNFSYLDRRSHLRIIGMVKSIIPSCYDYQLGYLINNTQNLNTVIPFPFDLENYQTKINEVNNKIRLFHGITRSKNKGSQYILEALKIVEKKFPNEVEVRVVEKVPYNEYVKIVNNSDVFFDQCLSYSYGYNALIGLANGKIVMSGAEPIAIKSLKLLGQCPVKNIIPDTNQIVSQIEELIQNKADINQSMLTGVEFLKLNHSSEVVAKKYIDAWKS